MFRTHFSYWFFHEIQDGYGLLLVCFTFAITAIFNDCKTSKPIGEYL